MSYMIIRVFAANQAVDINAVSDAARTQLVPQLEEVPGFERYVAFLAKNGRYGATIVVDSKQAADQVMFAVREWAQGVPGHKDSRLEINTGGEVGLAIVGSVPLTAPGLYGVLRLYRTDASFKEVNAAIEEEAGTIIREMPGLARYTTVKCEDGRIATVSSFDSERNARALTDKAHELRQKDGSRLAETLPNDPEVMEAKALFAVVKERPKGG
jgi:hypothetical protein